MFSKIGYFWLQAFVKFGYFWLFYMKFGCGVFSNLATLARTYT